MTLDPDVICISGVPIAGIAANGAASAWNFLIGDRKLVRLSTADHELALAMVADFAGNRTFEKAVPQPLDHDLLEMCKHLTDLTAMCSWH